MTTTTSKYLGLFLCLLSISYSLGQTPPTRLEDNAGVSIGLLTFGINYEFPISQKMTLNAVLIYGAGFGGGSEGKIRYIFTPLIGAEARYYYNRARRIKKGKSIAENAGNFIVGDVSYTPNIGTISSGSNFNVIPSLLLGVNYGIRRNITRKLNYEFTFGIGSLFPEGRRAEIVPLLNIKLQYILF